MCKTPKSDLFRDLLPMLNSGSITLPRNDRLIAQIAGLERRVTRAGKDFIMHPDHGHDDLANCVAGAATSLRFPTYNFAAFVDDDIPGVDSWYYMELMQHIARYG